MSLLGYQLIEKASSIRNLQNEIALANGAFLSVIQQDLRLIYQESKQQGFYTDTEFAPLVTRDKDYGLLLKDINRILAHPAISEFEEDGRMQTLKTNLRQYDSLQSIIMSLQKERGFKDAGLEGEMREYVHQLETYIQVVPLSDILTLRRHEKDYFMRDDMQYANYLNDASNTLQASLNPDSDEEEQVLSLLRNYTRTFNAVVDIEQKIGDASSGIQSQLFARQMEMEASFANLLRDVNDKTRSLIYRLIQRFLLLVIVGFLFASVLSYSIATFVSASIKKMAISMQEAIETGFRSQLRKPHRLAAKETKSLFRSYEQLISTIRQQLEELQENNERIHEKNEELRQINARLESSEQRLRESNAAKDKFFTIIGHDLKSPMSTMTSLLHLLFENINDFSKNESAEMANNVLSSANSISLLLENLLAWARNQTEKIEVIKDYVDLNDLILENIKLFEAKMKEKSIEVHFKAKKHIEAFVDRNMIDFVIRNLLDNAIKFTPEQGSIMITSSGNGETVSFSIKDTGIGIEEDKIPTLFSSIVKEQSRGTSGEKGSGIGLVLCYDFIQKNHGTIQVRSTVDIGSTFSVRLPKTPVKQNRSTAIHEET
jgi:signal transduction histidine kinase